MNGRQAPPVDEFMYTLL